MSKISRSGYCVIVCTLVRYDKGITYVDDEPKSADLVTVDPCTL